MPDTSLLPESNQIKQTEEVILPIKPLQLNGIEDKDLLAIIRERLKLSEAYYRDKLKLKQRREKNEDMWVGKQIENEGALYDWQVPYKDNLIWQDLETKIAITSSRIPDIVVVADDPELRQQMEKALEIRINNDSTKRIIKSGLRHLYLYLQGAVKILWDQDKGPTGDYRFELVPPDRLIVDHTAIIPEDGFTADNMEYIAQWIDEPASAVIAKFPDKKDELFKRVGIMRGTPRQMAAKIKYLEVWFTYYGGEKPQEGVCWIYQDLILDKKLNPYYDWEGYQKQVQGGYEKFYFNHFERPRKPYIFFTYQNLGKDPIEATSAVEQAIPLQKLVNKRGRQITELADRAGGKLAFASKFITRDGARQVTWDMDEHIYLDKADKVGDGVQFFAGQMPSPVLYQDLASNRNQIDSKFATHGTTRGEVQPNESGVSKQVTREGDLGMQDDLATITVQRVTYEMSNWAVHMMKVLYDEEHFVKDIGKDGELINISLKRDLIADGLAVNVKASSVDKQQRRADALNLAARKAIDPLSLFEDMDVSNPKERTKRLVAFLSGDNATYAQVVGIELNPTTPDQGQDQGQGGDKEQAINDIARLIAGEEVEPTLATPEYIQTINAYVNSPSFQQEPPDAQQRISDFIPKLRTVAQPENAEPTT